MTDHEKLMVALTESDNSKHEGPMAIGDVVCMLYELGARYREQAREHLELKAAS